MKEIAFITGVTGFIGGELARHIFESDKYSKVYLLIRPFAKFSAEDRFDKIKVKWEEIHHRKYPDTFFHVISGDIVDPNTFQIPGEVNMIFHAAASTRFDDSLRYARELNLYATQNLLLKARQCSNLRLFVHFSTAFVSGTLLGRVQEQSEPKSFFNAYEASKYECEQCIKSYDVPFLILRPSIVVGDSKTGFTQHYRVFYSMLRVWLAGKIPRAPLHRKPCVDIVPVDFVCKGAISLSSNPKEVNDTFHLCAGKEGLVDPISIFQYAIQVFQLKSPPISPVWVVYFLNSAFIKMFLNRPLREYLSTMQWHFPYMSARDRFYDMSKSLNLLRKDDIECPKLPVYGDIMFRFCKETNWGRNLKGLRNVRD